MSLASVTSTRCTVWPLMSSPRMAGGLLPRLVGRLGQLDAAGLAPATGLHLRLDHDRRCRARRAAAAASSRRLDRPARQHRDAVRGEEVLRLVLVEVHSALPCPLRGVAGRSAPADPLLRDPSDALAPALTCPGDRSHPAAATVRSVQASTELRRATVGALTYRPAWRRSARTVGRLATAAGRPDGRGELARAGAYAARTFGSPAGVRGLAVECAWLAAHVAALPGRACCASSWPTRRLPHRPAAAGPAQPRRHRHRGRGHADPAGARDHGQPLGVHRVPPHAAPPRVRRGARGQLQRADRRHPHRGPRAARPRRAAARAHRRRPGAHRRPLARRHDRPLLRAADGRLRRCRHAGHAGQPARRHARAPT